MIVNTDPVKYNEDLIKKAVSILKNGGIVVFPTETAYGIGCDAYNKDAVKKIYSIKNRHKDNPLPVIVSSKEMIEEIAYITPESRLLIDNLYPGPLVIALLKKPIIPDEVNKKNIAFRISSNPIISEIVKQLERPIVATSANLSGDKTPYSITDVRNSLAIDKIDLIIDVGILEKIKPSTIVDFTLSPCPQIIRIGGITADEIFNLLKIDKVNWKNHIID